MSTTFDGLEENHASHIPTHQINNNHHQKNKKIKKREGGVVI